MKFCRFAVLAAGLIAVLALTACGGKVIDSVKAEEFINQDLTSAGVKVESVSCPKSVEVKAGVDFACEVSADGGEKAVVTMRIIDSEGKVEPTKIESVDGDNGKSGAEVKSE